MRYLIAAILAVLAFGCGSQGENSETQTDTGSNQADQASDMLSLAVEKETDLPPCLAKNENQLIYVEETLQFLVCKDESWATIELPRSVQAEEADDADIEMVEEPVGNNCEFGGVAFSAKGKVFYACNGEPGQNGKDGKDGTDAASGDWVIDKMYECGGSSKDIVTGGSDLYAINTRVIKYKNGKHWIEALFSLYSFRGETCHAFGTTCQSYYDANQYILARFHDDGSKVTYDARAIANGTVETASCTQVEF